MSVETSFDTPSAPIGTKQRAREIEHHYDRVETKVSLEQEGYICTEYNRFSMDVKGEALEVQIEDFPQGNLILQPPMDDDGQWQLMNKLITNGPKVFMVGGEYGIGRVTELENETEFVVFGATSDKEIARIKFVPVGNHIVCGIKAV